MDEQTNPTRGTESGVLTTDGHRFTRIKIQNPTKTKSEGEGTLRHRIPQFFTSVRISRFWEGISRFRRRRGAAPHSSPEGCHMNLRVVGKSEFNALDV